MLFFRHFDHFAPFIPATMRASAMRHLGFVTVGTLGPAGNFQMIMGPARGGAFLGVSSFWIWHLYSFGLKFFECRPTVVHGPDCASAAHQVPILPADRTDPMAILTADLLHRHSEQNILSQDLFQFDPAPFIQGDLALSFI